MSVFLTCCVGLDHDIVLLDAFCRHYLDLGIEKDKFLLVLNTSDNGNRINRIDAGNAVLKKYGIEPMDIWCTRYESEEKWRRVHDLLSKYVGPNDWVVHPDTDEFHEIPFNDYHEMIVDFESRGVNAVQGILIDRLRNDCTIPKNIEGFNDIFEEFPKHANLSSLLKIAGVKLMAYKGNMRANNGSGQIHQSCRKMVSYAHGGNQSIHTTQPAINLLGDPDLEKRTAKLEDLDDRIDEIRSQFNFLVHHFKWHGLVVEKLLQRVQTYTALQRPQVHQSIRALEHYGKNGKFLLDKGDIKDDK